MAASDFEAQGSAPSEVDFEEILRRLSTVVDQLESGELSLERSLDLFEEGVRLSRQGSTRLDQAERRIEKLLGADGGTEAWTSAGKETESR
jgi:exodeoxyribonuclease VII small subunit